MEQVSMYSNEKVNYQLAQHEKGNICTAASAPEQAVLLIEKRRKEKEKGRRK
jgi:hypothetical protein